MRQACYQCIASQARAASECLASEEAEERKQYDGSAVHAEAAGLICLMLHPGIWGCIINIGLLDPCCEATAAEIVHCCARAAHAAAPAMQLPEECGLQLAESVPKLACYLHNENMSAALALISSWQQHHICCPGSSSSSHFVAQLRQLNLLHQLQQLFHKAADVRAAAALHVQAAVPGLKLLRNAAADWNRSFEALISAIALPRSQGRCALHSLSSAIR